MIILRTAKFSPDRIHRYSLTRKWSTKKPACMFIGLNPSTADEHLDDPTIRRCMRFAKDWGFGELVMTNIFAFRATLPADMKNAADPVGPDNDREILVCAKLSEKIVAAWGEHGMFMARDVAVIQLLRSEGFEICCLGRNKSRQPKHPLYLRADSCLELM